MTEAGEHDVFELIELVFDALIDAWVGMPKHIDPPGAHGVQITLPVEVLKPHALTTPDRNQRKLLVIFHLGAGVPEYG